jgi:hypothetical protein
MDTLEIIKTISADNNDCTHCPNFPNKPETEGCGMDICLEKIHKLASNQTD